MASSGITRLLIANRGEIACRITKTAKQLGIKTIAVFSEADKKAQHVKLADESYCIGKPAAQLSYLNVNKLMEIAKISKAHAVHPGYGFLSESFEFANTCRDNNLIFVGPPPSAIYDMGIKSKSKSIMIDAGVPVINGYHGEEQSDNHLISEAKKIGFPVMIKAVRGGGGKGMRIAMTEEEFIDQLGAARRESLKAFNDDNMLIEKYILNPRHVEVQVFGDQHGNYVYLWERDCSVQRRHQKVLEEAPAPGLTWETRRSIGEAAVRAARAVKYVGAGTVEFVMDANQKFYFMEMNTRLQVEHPVSEAITKTDLVEWQLRVANGEELPIPRQEDIPLHGHAFEARIYAEDCSNPAMMLPAAGTLNYLATPPSSCQFNFDSNVRVDSAVVQGDEISIHYDPMIAKLVVWAHNREAALTKLNAALKQYRVTGLPTNIDFLKRLCEHPVVRSGVLDTGFIANHIQDLSPLEMTKSDMYPLCCSRAALGISAFNLFETQNSSQMSPFQMGWRVNSEKEDNLSFALNGNPIEAKTSYSPDTKIFKISLSNGQNAEFKVDLISCRAKELKLRLEQTSDGSSSTMTIVSDSDGYNFHVFDDHLEWNYNVSLPEPKYLRELAGLSGDGSGADGDDPLKGVSPMPGVIEKILVSVGDSVKKGQPLITLIAMKMEYTIRAGADSTVKTIKIKEGDTVNNRQLLVQLNE